MQRRDDFDYSRDIPNGCVDAVLNGHYDGNASGGDLDRHYFGNRQLKTIMESQVTHKDGAVVPVASIA